MRKRIVKGRKRRLSVQHRRRISEALRGRDHIRDIESLSRSGRNVSKTLVDLAHVAGKVRRFL